MKRARKLEVIIDLNNEAFVEVPSGTEAANILRRLADRIDGDVLHWNDFRPLLDSNGNRVGQMKTGSFGK